MKYLLSFASAALVSLACAVGSQAQDADTALQHSREGSTKIILSIGDKQVPAVLYNNTSARDLMAKLPVTVSLNRGPVDYCGGIASIAYRENDVQAEYRSGDLAYWIPGRDFVIFIENNDMPSGTPDLVIIGKISSDIKEIRDLTDRSIEVTITLEK